MLERLSRGRRNLGLAVLGALIVWFCWTIRSVLNPLLLGYLCAYVLHPLVLFVEQHGLSRRSAVNLIFSAGFVAAAVIALVLAVQVQGLARDVVANERLHGTVQERYDDFRAWLRDTTSIDLGEVDVPDQPEELRQLARELLAVFGDELPAAGEPGRARENAGAQGPAGEDAPRAGLGGPARQLISDYGAAAVQKAGGVFGRSLRFLARSLGRLFAIGGYLLLVPLYAYFLLFELGRLHAFVRRYVPKHERARVARAGAEIGEVLSSFFRGRLTVCLLKGVLLSLGLWIGGIDYALLFGMGSGFLSLVPFVGPLAGFLAAAAVGIVEHGILDSIVRTAVVFGLGELIEGYVLIPKILGDSLGLHPLVVLFAMLAGGASLGMLGILIALPLTASVVILVKEFVLPALAQWSDEDAPDAPAP